MEEKIINYILHTLHSGEDDLQVAPQEDLLGSGLVDSMGMMRLVQFIEDEYQLKVAFQDMTIDNFRSVDAMTNFIKKKKVNGN